VGTVAEGAWDPAGQARVLGWLEPVIRRLPWDSTGSVHEQYREEAAKLAAEQIPDYAFHATRTVLTRVIDCRFSAVVVALIAGRNPAWTKVPVDLGHALTTVHQY
jgi:hypothetical protein